MRRICNRITLALSLSAALVATAARSQEPGRPSPSPEQQSAVDDLYRSIQQNWIRPPTAAEQAKIDSLGPAMQNSMQRAAADEMQRRLNKDHDAVAELMGVNPREASLYVFVSHSMSAALIKSYLREAMWAHAALVVRGIPKEMKMGQYIRAVLWPFMKDTSALGSFTIDPPLFDLYGIDKVPTIVWDETHIMNRICTNTQKTVTGPRGKPVTYKPCAPVSPENYWKVSGAVTLDWALEQFSRAGAQQAENRLSAMRKRLGGGALKAQQPFAGDFSKVLTPEQYSEVEAAEATVQRRRALEETLVAPVVAPVPH